MKPPLWLLVKRIKSSQFYQEPTWKNRALQSVWHIIDSAQTMLAIIDVVGGVQ